METTNQKRTHRKLSKKARRRRRRRRIGGLFVSILLLASLAVFGILYDGPSVYPEPLQTALENNPELKEFAKGYEGAMEAGERDRTDACELTDEERSEKYPLFLQWDKRWGYRAYGEHVIGLSGCGPTCMSMVLYSLKGDETMTPDSLARFADAQGYYVEGSGTAWSFMTEGARSLGLNVREVSLDEGAMKSRLDEGSLIICSMGPGDFTKAGHFIVIYGYDEDGFLVNDPNSVQRSGERWSFDKIRYQIRNLWAYC